MLKNNTYPHISGPSVSTRPLIHAPHLYIASRVVKRALLCLAIAYGVVVAAQLVYPAKRSVPGITYAGYSLGNATRDDIKKQLSEVNSKTFTARTESRSYAQSLSEIGISLDTDKIANKLSDYPITQRLLPFSVFYYQPTAPDNHLTVYDQDKLNAFAQKVAAESNTLPTEGSIINENSELTIERSIAGRAYSADTISSYFMAYTNETLAEEATLPHEAISPVNSYQYLEELVNSTNKLTAQEHTISYQGNSYAVKASAVKRAVQFVKDDSQKVVLSFDTTVLATGLEAAADGLFYAPGGAVGHEFDWQVSAENLAAALVSSTQATAVIKPLAAGSSRYAATSNGIQKLITDWQASHASIDPVISFAEIGGYGRSAAVGGDTRYFSASVYKVFPAWYALDQIDQNKLDPAGVIAAGMKLDACFHDMIIISQSNCSEAIVYKYGGFAAMDQFARDHGIEGITLANGVTITANGMVSFMTKLHNGELLSPERTTYLLDAMKRQKYRTGFPAGSIGPVANKVGFQPRTKSWHDAGIIYDPKTTYILVVLTKQGATLPTLSTLAAQISATLNR